MWVIAIFQLGRFTCKCGDEKHMSFAEDIEIYMYFMLLLAYHVIMSSFEASTINF